MPRKPFTLIPEKMAAVIAAALDEFSRYGYSHASTNRICQQAEVSKGALFHNFHSKGNLFHFLIQDGIKTAEQVFREHLAAASRYTSFEEYFVASFFVLIDFVRDHPHHYNIYLRLIYDPDIPEQERVKARQVVQTFTATISRALYHEGRRRLLLRPELSDKMVEFLLNTIITRFVELYYFPMRDPGIELSAKNAEELKENILTLYAMIMQGLSA
jgi:TetR/AcrR family transcriptional regulator